MKKILIAALLTTSMTAKAYEPVVDIMAIVANAQQLSTLGKQLGVDTQQLQNMIQQLMVAKQTFDAVTGKTSGGYTLSQINQIKGYLPSEYQQLWNQVSQLRNGGAGYGNSAAILKEYQTANLAETTITPESQDGEAFLTMAALKSQSRAEYEEAFSNANDTYAQISTLLDRVEQAQTLKESQDLGNKVGLMNVVLTNDGNRIRALQALNEAEMALQAQKSQSNGLSLGLGRVPDQWMNGSAANPEYRSVAYNSDGSPVN